MSDFNKKSCGFVLKHCNLPTFRYHLCEIMSIKRKSNPKLIALSFSQD